MKHNCPHCGATREVNPKQVPAEGLTIQCFNCFKTYHFPLQESGSMAAVDGANSTVGTGEDTTAK